MEKTSVKINFKGVQSFVRKVAPWSGTAAGGVISGAAGGYILGKRIGANRAANQMATAFQEANARENSAIVDSFNAQNKIENNQIAQAFYNRGLKEGSVLSRKGVRKHASITNSQSHQGGTMDKHAALEQIRQEAFKDEMDKIAKMNPGKILDKVKKGVANLYGKSAKGVTGLYGKTEKGVTKGVKTLGKSYASVGKALASAKARPALIATGAIGALGGAGAFLASRKKD